MSESDQSFTVVEYRTPHAASTTIRGHFEDVARQVFEEEGELISVTPPSRFGRVEAAIASLTSGDFNID